MLQFKCLSVKKNPTVHSQQSTKKHQKSVETKIEPRVNNDLVTLNALQMNVNIVLYLLDM